MIKQKEFDSAIEKNDIEKFKLLIQDENVNPSCTHNYALRLSSKLGHTTIVKLLLNDKRVNYIDDICTAFCRASEYGHIEVVKILLTNKGFTPAINCNEAIIKSYHNGYDKVVQLLWQDVRIKNSLNEDDKELYGKLLKKDVQIKLGTF